jgi:hypothetical protein
MDTMNDPDITPPYGTPIHYDQSRIPAQNQPGVHITPPASREPALQPPARDLGEVLRRIARIEFLERAPGLDLLREGLLDDLQKHIVLLNIRLATTPAGMERENAKRELREATRVMGRHQR